MTPVLILPVGPPGAGKTTLRNYLLENEVIDADAIVCPDDYRRILTGSVASQDENSTVFSICNGITRARLRRGLHVFFDATNFRNLGEFRKIADEAKAAIVCVRFVVPFSQLVARNAEREQPVPAHVLTNMFVNFVDVPLADYPGVTITPAQVPYYLTKEILNG